MKPLLLTLFFCGLSSVARAEIIVSFSVLEDLVRQLAPAEMKIQTLVPAGRDAHGHSLSARDLKALKKARLLVSVGEGYEPWLDRALKAEKTNARRLLMTEGLTLRMAVPHEHGDHHDHSHHHDHGPRDPHVWLNPEHVLRFSERLRVVLVELAPERRAEIEARAKAWIIKVQAARDEWRRAFAGVPRESRVAVVPHAAFGYLGEVLEVKFLTLTGVASDVEPSARHLANLVKIIRGGGARALFHEGDVASPLIESLRKETGLVVAGHLYADTLSSRSDGPHSYLEMMKHNVEALRRGFGVAPAANHPKN